MNAQVAQVLCIVIPAIASVIVALIRISQPK